MTLFADGEPLDVDKLNQLAADINKVKSEFESFSRSYNTNNNTVTSTVPIIATGSVKINAGPNSSGRTISIPSNVFANVDSNPVVFVTAGDNIGNKSVTFSVYEITRSSFVLDAHASESLGSITVNWVAVAMKTLAN